MMVPRSILHAQPPIGIGTEAPESLLSYFCRLAVSHSLSTADLARFIVDHVNHDITPGFEWQQRNLSGISQSARSWSAWLSAVTGIERLDLLTLSNWSKVLPTMGLAPRHAHWCPHCLTEDRQSGQSPYFRLNWEVGPVEACHRHKVQLVDTCPHCGKRHVRHQAGIVVPGWCTKCGGFLGEAKTQSAAPRQIWVARQVAQWLGGQTTEANFPEGTLVSATINRLILALDEGRPARFAKRIGQAKSTVHGWLNDGNLPSLQAYLAMALHTGLSLDKLLRGELEGWKAPDIAVQLAMPFDLNIRPIQRPPRRQLDWSRIRSELVAMLRLPRPISVSEASRRLEVDVRSLYLQANAEARTLSERWKRHQKSQVEARRETVRQHLREILPEVLENGLPCNLRQLQQVVPSKVLNSVQGAFDLIREAREEAAMP